MSNAQRSRVTLRDSAGTVFNVPAEKADTYLARGATAVTDEEIKKLKSESEYGGTGGELIAGGLGALRGASFGASDWLLRGVGVQPKTLAGYRESNPKASIAGEIGGAVVPMVFSGGTSAAASGATKGASALTKTARTVGYLPGKVMKLGARVEGGVARALGEEALTSIGGKVAAKALAKGAGGAVEGGIYGAGQLVSEAALGDPQEVAEKAAAHIGMSMLLGGGIGAAIGGISGTVSGVRASSAARAADKAARQQATAEAATAAIGPEAAPATGETGFFGGIKAFFRDAKEEAAALADADYLRARAAGVYGIKNVKRVRGSPLFNKTAEGVERDPRKFFGAKMRELGIVRGSDSTEQIAAKAQESASKWGQKIGEVLDEADAAVESGNVKIQNAVTTADGRTAAVDLKSILGKAKEKITKEFAVNRGTLADKAAAEQIAAEIDNLAATHGDATSLSNLHRIKTALKNASKFDAARPTAINDAYQDLYLTIRDASDNILDEVTKAAGGKVENLGQRLRTANENWLASKMAADFANEAVSRKAGYASLSLSDVGVGIGSSAALGGPVGMVAGAASAIASRVFKRRAPQLMASLIDTVTLRRFGVERLAQASGAAGSRLDAMVDKLAASVAPTVRGVARVATSAEARAAGRMAAKHTLKEEIQGQLEPRGLAHAAVPAVVGVAALKQINFGAPAQEDKGKSLYRRRYSELSRTLANPQALQAQIAKSIRGIDEAAPAVSAETGALVTRALQHLHDKAPKPPLHMDMAAATEPDGWEPNKHDLQAWLDRVHAVQRPIDTIEQALHGHVSAEAIDTIKTVYPALWRDVSAKVMAKYPELQKKLPYNRRLQLSRTMGAPFEQTARPSFVRNVQALYGGAPDQGAGQPKVRATGIDKMNIAGRDQTDMERRAQR